MKNSTLITGIVVVIVLVAAAFVVMNSAGTSDEKIKIGFIGPLTGEAATYGIALQNVVQLAADEINTEGGINGRVLEIVYEDGKCNGADAATAMRKLANVDQVEIVLGGFCSSESFGAEPVATENEIFLFSVGSSSPDLTGISPFFARSYPSDATQGNVLADIADSNGWKLVAFIQEQQDYPLGIFNAFASRFEELGGVVVKEEFPTGETDFRSALLKLRDNNPDALFIDTQTPIAAERILNQLQDMNWKPNILVSDAVSGDLDAVERNAEILEGALAAEFGTDENNEKFQNLLSNYKNKYGTDLTFLSYAQTEYDGVYIVKEAIEAVGYDGEKVAEYVRGLQNFEGASGTVNIGEDGDRTAGHVAKIIINGTTVPFE